MIMAGIDFPKFVKLEEGMIVNLNHVMTVTSNNDEFLMYIIGFSQPFKITVDDYDVISQASEYSEAMLYLAINDFTPMTMEKSLRLLTELNMHFIAHSIAHQHGTLDQFPLQPVFERIANIMNELNTSVDNQAVSKQNAEEEE